MATVDTTKPLADRPPRLSANPFLRVANDLPEHARELAALLDPRVYKINLIPYNPTGSIYDGSTRAAIGAFKAALEEHGLRATVRLTRGRDIDAACGQLAAKAAAA